MWLSCFQALECLHWILVQERSARGLIVDPKDSHASCWFVQRDTSKKGAKPGSTIEKQQ